MAASELIIKVDLDGDTRRLPLHGFPLELPIAEPAEMLAALRETVRRGFAIEGDDASGKPLMLRYADDEGDMCTLVEDTLSDALKLANGGPLKLQASQQRGGAPRAPAGGASRSSAVIARAAGGAQRGGEAKGEKGWGRGEKAWPEKGKGKEKGSWGSRKGGERDLKSSDAVEDNGSYGEFQARVDVAEEELDLAFDFRTKIIGDGAKNVRHIREHTGAHVWLKGRGSDFREKGSGRESDDPLHIFISSSSQASLDRAVEMANDLLSTVLDEYDAWIGGDEGSARNGKNRGKGKGKPKGKGKSKGKGKDKDSYGSRYDEDDRAYKRARYTADDGRRRGY